MRNIVLYVFIRKKDHSTQIVRGYANSSAWHGSIAEADKYGNRRLYSAAVLRLSYPVYAYELLVFLPALLFKVEDLLNDCIDREYYERTSQAADKRSSVPKKH